MITFACPTCRKTSSVKEDLAGKKGQCPACGQMVVIPAPVAARGIAERPTLPPSPGPARQDERTNALTHPPSNRPDSTQGGNKPDSGHDSSLTDFLGPPQADDELGRLGKYRVLKILGHGGMGVVYKAEDPKLRRSVAIKAMLPTLAASDSAGKRFLREAQAMAAVKHDHIATIYQVDEERGIPFLAMEFLAGQPLDERLKRDGKLPLGEVLRIGREIAEGLEAAHATGLIHRDIKPANIWLEAPRNRVKILDFGLARATSQDAGPTRQDFGLARAASLDAGLTQQGAIVGTPAYMAPEQGRGEAVDARCDLFSLGCVLYRMCTGHQPFMGKDITSTLMAVARHQPISPRQMNAEVPQDLSHLVMRLLEKDPDRRPTSAAEVVRILEVLQVKPVLATPTANPWEDITLSEPIPTPMAMPAVKAKRVRTPLLVGLGLLALVPLVWWLATVILRVETPNGTLIVEMNDPEVEARIKNGKLILTGPDGKVRYTLTPSERNRTIETGEYTIRVKGADGLVLDTTAFTLTKGETITVGVTLAPRPVAKTSTAADPDRRAAEYVLSIGGTVRVDGNDRDVRSRGELPRGAFRLTHVGLHKNNLVSDSGLAAFKDCKNVKVISLYFNPQVTDAGLACFKDCKTITQLHLQGTAVTDAGLAYFKDRKIITDLYLDGTKVTDGGLAHFKDCQGLWILSLSNTKVTDRGLASFKDCKKLTVLGLEGTQVSDEGLASFKDCKNLTWLGLRKTKVTRAKIEELKKALPKCRIEWDGM